MPLGKVWINPCPYPIHCVVAGQLYYEIQVLVCSRTLGNWTSASHCSCPCKAALVEALDREDDADATGRAKEDAARKLEAQLDDQMNTYRKLVSVKSNGSENHIESDIERSLKQLQQVNSQMQTWVSSGGSEVLSHTLTRHMEILQDLSQEFFHLRSSLRAKQQHASLLDFRDFDRASFDVEEAADSSDQSLLKEQAAITRSTGQAVKPLLETAFLTRLTIFGVCGLVYTDVQLL
ncbi:hypothetical protein C2845_PM14G15460 [Panicum miliaceum]|uniref:Uncharacterized protein n=1 Tax=Panicum miliaceum TaxID=4540 RepID=A0A3L6PR00_PANMI|nr:hypothetical protein C2845_PM14G15460 [Panicum miliaceum]